MVMAGEIVAGKYVRLACKRHLDDLKESKNKSLFAHHRQRGVYVVQPEPISVAGHLFCP